MSLSKGVALALAVAVTVTIAAVAGTNTGFASQAGVIAGRVLNEEGAPIAGVRVEALRSQTESGRRALVSVAWATTDDKGEFRLAGLTAGQYYVSATAAVLSNAAGPAGALRYAPTYYPGAAVVEDAVPVSAATDAEPKKIEFRLRLMRPASVSGTLSTEDGRRLLSAALTMVPQGREDPGAPHGEVAEFLPDGRFSFRNVPPGRYQIRARGETDPKGVTLFATYLLTVDGREVTNVVMTMSRGAILTGSLERRTVRGTRFKSYAGVRVRAPLADGSGFGDALTGEVDMSGRFRIRGLMAGEHVITVEGLPAPWVIEKVTIRGRDITRERLYVDGPEELHDVRITIADVSTPAAVR